MFNGVFHIPQPANEKVLDYAPGTEARAELKAKLAEMLAQPTEVPMFIGGKEIRDGKPAQMRCPHDHKHVLGNYHQGNAYFVEQAIQAANDAKHDWSRAGVDKGGRAAVDQVPRGHQRRNDVEHVQDAAPGGGRLRVRAGGLLAVQSALHAPGVPGSADLDGRGD